MAHDDDYDDDILEQLFDKEEKRGIVLDQEKLGKDGTTCNQYQRLAADY